MPSYFLIFLTALLLSLTLVALFMGLALKINFVTPQGVTYLGGLGMWLAFAIICVLDFLS